jgi:hypothetical protein
LPSDAAAAISAAAATNKAHGDYAFLEQDPASDLDFSAEDGDATPRARSRDQAYFAAMMKKNDFGGKTHPDDENALSSSSSSDDGSDNGNDENDDGNESEQEEEKTLQPSHLTNDPALAAALAAVHNPHRPHDQQSAPPSRSPSTDRLRLAKVPTGMSGISASSAGDASGDGFVTPRSQRSFATGLEGGRQSTMSFSHSVNSSRDSFGEALEEIRS